MPALIHEVPEIDEELWNAWVLRHKRREERNARLATRFAVSAALLGLVGTTVFLLLG